MHFLPQIPQLRMSFAGFTHAPSQHSNPGPQAGVQVAPPLELELVKPPLLETEVVEPLLLLLETEAVPPVPLLETEVAAPVPLLETEVAAPVPERRPGAGAAGALGSPVTPGPAREVDRRAAADRQRPRERKDEVLHGHEGTTVAAAPG